MLFTRNRPKREAKKKWKKVESRPPSRPDGWAPFFIFLFFCQANRYTLLRILLCEKQNSFPLRFIGFRIVEECGSFNFSFSYGSLKKHSEKYFGTILGESLTFCSEVDLCIYSMRRIVANFHKNPREKRKILRGDDSLKTGKKEDGEVPKKRKKEIW